MRAGELRTHQTYYDEVNFKGFINALKLNLMRRRKVFPKYGNVSLNLEQSVAETFLIALLKSLIR